MADAPSSSAGERPQGGVGRAVAKGVVWSTLGGVAERLIGFLSLAVVVRLMTLEEAGIAMLAASTFDVILNLSTAGFGERIIQNPRTDRRLEGTVFWLQMGVCTLLAIAFYLAAEPVAALYGEPRVVPLLHVMSVLIISRAVPVVPAALLARSMKYGALTLGTLLTSLASAAAGIAIALAGYPIWALVSQFLASSVVFAFYAWFVARWVPPLMFSWREAWRTITFSTPLLGSSLMTSLSTQVSTLMIGLSLPVDAVALFRVAARLYEVMGQVLLLPVQRVLLATFSILRDDRARAQDAFLSMLRVLAAVAFAAYALVAAQAHDIMRILFGPRWEPSGEILMLLAVGVVGLVVRAFVQASLTAVGRTRLVLLFTAATTVGMVVAVSVAARYSEAAVAAAQSGLLLATVPMSLLAFRLALGIPPLKALACLPQPLLAALAGAAASHFVALWIAPYLPVYPLPKVIVAGAAGAIVFAAAHFALGPRRTRQTVAGVLALVRRRSAG